MYQGPCTQFYMHVHILGQLFIPETIIDDHGSGQKINKILLHNCKIRGKKQARGQSQQIEEETKNRKQETKAQT